MHLFPRNVAWQRDYPKNVCEGGYVRHGLLTDRIGILFRLGFVGKKIPDKNPLQQPKSRERPICDASPRIQPKTPEARGATLDSKHPLLFYYLSKFSSCSVFLATSWHRVFNCFLVIFMADTASALLRLWKIRKIRFENISGPVGASLRLFISTDNAKFPSVKLLQISISQVKILPYFFLINFQVLLPVFQFIFHLF